MNSTFDKRLQALNKAYTELINKKNKIEFSDNGLFNRYKDPILLPQHIPLEWRFDLDPFSNPFFCLDPGCLQ